MKINNYNTRVSGSRRYKAQVLSYDFPSGIMKD